MLIPPKANNYFKRLTHKHIALFCFFAVLFVTGYANNVVTKLAYAHNLIGVYFQNKSLPNLHSFRLTSPERLVLDMKHTTTSKHFKAAPGGDVTAFHFHQYKHKLRFVFTLHQSFTYKIQKLAHHLSFRLRLAPTPKHTKSTPMRDAVVVLDPGHGGKDPGATGPKGIHEKNVVLKIAKDCRQDLRNMAGIQVDMTRTGDYFVTLRGRLRLARKDKADVFMAIHADSFPRKTARGASVFALSEHGASSEAARWLAHSENNAVLGGAGFSDQTPEVRSVLLDLSQSITIAHSLGFGRYVKNALARITPLHSNKVEQAPFMVLKSPDIPSLLVETGFISNYKEEAQLNSTRYQKKIAMALANGIRAYLYAHPPRNTLIEKQTKGQLNDTLKHNSSVKSLAHYFNVSAKTLASANHLNINASLKKGETLHIPR